MYDINYQNSFNFLSIWLKWIKPENDNKYLCKVLVGNKYSSSDRKVTEEEGKKLADEYDCSFFRISTENNQNINEVFDRLLNEIFISQKKKNADKKESIKIHDYNNKKDGKKRCYK